MIEHAMEAESDLRPGCHILSGIARTFVDYHLDCYDFVILVLDGIRYHIYVDPCDGMRSTGHLVTMEYLRGTWPFSDISLKNLEDAVIIPIPGEPLVVDYEDEHFSMYDSKRFYTFRNTDTGETVLRIGTNHYDDCYPMAIFEWKPENLSCNRNVPKRIDITELPECLQKVVTFNMKDGKTFIGRIMSLPMDLMRPGRHSFMWGDDDAVCVTDVVRKAGGTILSGTLNTGFVNLGRPERDIDSITTTIPMDLEVYDQIISESKKDT